MRKQCYLCEDLAKGGNTFLERDYAVALWDGYPVAPGHALIIPRRHVQYLEDLSEEELADIMHLSREGMNYIKTIDIEKLYEQKLSEEHADPVLYRYYEKALAIYKSYNRAPAAFNLGINNGIEAGQTVPHLHLHLIPRWAGDVEDSRGGVRNVLQDIPKEGWDV